MDSASLDAVRRAVNSGQGGMLVGMSAGEKSMVQVTLNSLTRRGGLTTMPEVREAMKEEYTPSIGDRRRKFLLGLLGLVLG